MKRALSAICLLLSAISGRDAAAQGVRIKLPAWQEPVLLDSMRQEHTISAPADVVYRAVLDAYRDLGIPTGNTDGKSGIIGSERFEKMRNIASAPMSMSFSCGESATGPNADSYRLTIAIVTWVKPREQGGTLIGIAAVASGEDIGGVRKNPRECASTGRVEMKIKERVEKLVQR
jgi:hypothetical protein